MIVAGDDLRRGAGIIDLDEVAQRRERLLAYTAATRAVMIYRFAIPNGATVAGLGRGDARRDARAQLDLIVGVTGGAIAKGPGRLAARIPTTLAARVEALAGPLVAANLVSLELAQPAQA